MLHRSNVLVVLAASVYAGCPFSSKAVSEMSESELASCPHPIQQSVAPGHTVQGCTCKTPCAASLEQDNFNCDWCYTENSCGNTGGLKGSYDFCDYSPDETVESASWSTKLDNLWSAVTMNSTSGKYPDIAGIFVESIQTTFDDFSDVMPVGRSKYIHSVGAVCKFSMDISSQSPFTGLFEAGNTVHGLVRMGSALAVDTTSGIAPGVGVKFLRSGVPSGNFVGLVALEPLPNNNYNFFAANLSNHIPAAVAASSQFLVGKFVQASSCPTQVGLSDICRYDINGKKTSDSNIKFPYKVVLDSGSIHTPSSPSSQATLQNNILSAVAGASSLYKIYAYTSPTASFTLGSMQVDKDGCTNSAFGDASLFFKHDLIEHDWALRPDFFKAANTHDCGPVEKITITPPSPQCASS